MKSNYLRFKKLDVWQDTMLLCKKVYVVFTGKKESKPYGMNKKELRRQFNKKRMKDAESCKRIKELDTDKIRMMLKMFYSAVYRCLRIDYVLVDSISTGSITIGLRVRR